MSFKVARIGVVIATVATAGACSENDGHTQTSQTSMSRSDGSAAPTPSTTPPEIGPSTVRATRTSTGISVQAPDGMSFKGKTSASAPAAGCTIDGRRSQTAPTGLPASSDVRYALRCTGNPTILSVHYAAGAFVYDFETPVH